MGQSPKMWARSPDPTPAVAGERSAGSCGGRAAPRVSRVIVGPDVALVTTSEAGGPPARQDPQAARQMWTECVAIHPEHRQGEPPSESLGASAELTVELFEPHMARTPPNLDLGAAEANIVSQVRPFGQ